MTATTAAEATAVGPPSRSPWAGGDRLELGARRTELRHPAGMVVLLAVFAVLLWLLADTPPRLAVGAGLILALVLDGVLAHGTLAAPALRLDGPPDATVGETVPLVLELESRRYPVRVRSLATWPVLDLAVDRREPGVVAWPAGRRGIQAAVHVELTATGPLGLFATRRRARCWLPRPLVVAPAPATHDLDLPALRTIRTGLTETSPSGHDLFRGVRPYVPGDARRLVHWKATARQGELMVRESDGTGIVALEVVLDLTGGGPAAEAAAARAAHVVGEAFHRGWFVRLVTVEDEAGPGALPPLDQIVAGPPPEPPPPLRPVTVTRVVRSPRELRARLAAACVGQPVPGRWRGPTRWIGAAGDRWQ